MIEKKINIPKEIKEYRVDKLIKCLDCIDKYAFNRDNQKECILKLYPTKESDTIEHRDKSIFRGMVIPSLRYLGLIIGHSDFIRASANGKILIESQFIDNDLHQWVLRVIFFEIDENKFHFINTINKYKSITTKDFINHSLNNVLSEKSKKDRIKKWLSILKQVKFIESSYDNLFIRKEEKISINKKILSQTLRNINIDAKNVDYFRMCFFETHSELAKGSAGIVDITDLREGVSLRFLKEKKMILTEDKFDKLSRDILAKTNEYIISLGKPMGAREKLFEYKDNFFRTMSIKIRKRKE